MDKTNIKYEKGYSTSFKESDNSSLLFSMSPQKEDSEEEKHKKEFDEMVQKIREYTSNNQRVLCEFCELLDKFTNVKNIPSLKEDVKKIDITLTDLRKLASKNDFDLDHLQVSDVIFGRSSLTEDLLIKMRKYLTCNPVVSSIRKTTILFLKDAFERLESQLSEKADKILIKEINCEVKSLHSYENADSHIAYELWSDGEIRSTKGGRLYGRRTFFTYETALVLPSGFEFPIKAQNSNLTYAILKEHDCTRIRSFMKATIR